MSLDSSLSVQKKDNCAGIENSSQKDFESIIYLISTINLFMESSSETFFDDSLFQEIIKYGYFFNYFDDNQVENIYEIGFFNALSHFELNQYFAQRIYEVFYYFASSKSPFHKESIQPHFLSSLNTVLSSEVYDYNTKAAALDFAGELASNSYDDLCKVIDFSIINSIYILLLNEPNDFLVSHILKALVMTTKSVSNPKHIIQNCPVSETELYLMIKKYLNSTNMEVKEESLKMLALIFSCNGSERCSINDEDISDVIQHLFSFAVNEKDNIKILSLDLLQRYSALQHYARLLVESGLFSAMKETISKGTNIEQCLFIISNTISWKQDYLTECIESGTYDFAVSIIYKGSHLESIAACYVVSQLFYQGSVEQILNNMSDELFESIMNYINEDDYKIAIAILDSFTRVLNIEQKEGTDIISQYLIDHEYVDHIAELSETTISPLKDMIEEFLAYFQKLDEK